MNIKERYHRKANSVGSFVLIYLMLGIVVIVSLLTIGLNPTLVISVVSAPIWIGIIFTAQAINKKVTKE
jgi:hypothetical protein